MTDKIGGKKLGGVKSATETAQINKTEQVHNAEGVKGVGAVAPTSGVGGVQSAGAIGKRGRTRAMTFAEREQILETVNEEAEKMFSAGVLPSSRKEVIKTAVRMAIDAGLLGEEEKKEKEQKKEGKE